MRKIKLKCRHCKSSKLHQFVDLGFQPPSNSYRSEEQLEHQEIVFPLRARVCKNVFWSKLKITHLVKCFLTVSTLIFLQLVSWLNHAKNYSKNIIKRLGLEKSFVVELACNDGYLLKNFKDAHIKCLGVEPTLSTASAAEKLGIEVIKDFFGQKLSYQISGSYKKADLIIANNVYAHVPDKNAFTLGIKNQLADTGVVTIEFPHLLNHIEKMQFDTIYHEHFSYFSLYTVNKIFEAFGLRVFDVERLPTHGGSLRIYGCHIESKIATCSAVSDVLVAEISYGLTSLAVYNGFQGEIENIKNNFLKLY